MLFVVAVYSFPFAIALCHFFTFLLGSDSLASTHILLQSEELMTNHILSRLNWVEKVRAQIICKKWRMWLETIATRDGWSLEGNISNTMMGNFDPKVEED